MAADLDAPPTAAHQVIRDGYALWCAAQPEAGLLPGRQHIRPRDMPALLPHVWLLDILAAAEPGNPPRLRTRLAGSHVGMMPALSGSGRWLDDIEPGFSHRPVLHASYMAAFRGRPQYHRGPPRLTCCQIATTEEMLLLPLAQDGRTINMLLGFVVFYASDGRVMPTGW